MLGRIGKALTRLRTRISGRNRGTNTSWAHMVAFRDIFTTLGIVLIVAGWSMLWSYVQSENKKREASTITQLKNTVLAVSHSISSDVEQIDHVLRLLAETKKHSGGSLPLYSMRNIFALKDDVLHVSFTDIDGNVRDNTYFENGTRSVNIRDREHFKVHLQSSDKNKLFISKPLQGRGTGKFTIQFSRGVYDDAGKLIGVMVAGISPEVLLKNLEDLTLGAASGIAMMGDDDVIRAGTGTFTSKIGLGFVEWEVVRTWGQGKVALTESQLGNQSQLIAMTAVRGYLLDVVIVTEGLAGSSGIFGYNSWMIAGALLFTMLIVSIIFIGRRRLAIEHLQIALREQIASNEMQSNFISMASHEFRTPLAIIDSSAQKMIARGGTMKPEDLVSRAKTVRSAVKRMTDLMESILVLAKTERGGLDLKLSTFSFSAVVNACVARAAELDPNRVISFTALDDAIDLHADKLLLEQVISNLLSNAAKYSEAGKPISVTIYEHAGAAVVEIADQGFGVHEAEVAKLFSRFFRAKTAEGIAGTGIGLYFVKMIIEKHGGSIAVKSQLGLGSTFTVRLPVKNVDKELKPASLMAA